MAYSENFPAQRAIFTLDAANAGRLDPRMTFTRASTANVWDGSKHLSSDNLLLQSSDFYNASWTRNDLGLTGSQTDPAGGTNGWTIKDGSATDFHRLRQSITAGSADYALVLYAKQNTGTRYLTLTLVVGAYNYEAATFDLAGGSPVMSSGSSSSFTSVSATQTLSGNGYYKCVLKATGSPVDARINLVNSSSPPLSIYGSLSYAGDNTSSIDIAFASLSTTGATDYNPTTTQIHREYAPSLVSKANNVGRFDHSTDGQSMGILIEGQSTNLRANSEQFNNWTQDGVLVDENSSIAPSGELTADTIRATGTGNHRIRQSVSIVSGSKFTGSFYAKANGYSHIQVGSANLATWAARAFFDLTNGTVGTITAGTAEIQSVGNGWYRCIVTGDGLATASVNIDVYPADGESASYVANEYGGTLLWGAMVEQSSHASSYIATTSSTVTRASESLSVTDSSLFDNGGGSLVVETENVGRAYYAAVLEDDSTGVYQDYVALTVRADNKARQTVNAPGSTGASDEFSAASTVGGSYFKIASRFAPNDFGVCIDGGTVSTDTTGAVPSNVDKLFIGWYDDGGRANAHIKRVAIYNEALSDTNLQALTS